MRLISQNDKNSIKKSLWKLKFSLVNPVDNNFEEVKLTLEVTTAPNEGMKSIVDIKDSAEQSEYHTIRSGRKINRPYVGRNVVKVFIFLLTSLKYVLILSYLCS